MTITLATLRAGDRNPEANGTYRITNEVTGQKKAAPIEIDAAGELFF